MSIPKIAWCVGLIVTWLSANAMANASRHLAGQEYRDTRAMAMVLTAALFGWALYGIWTLTQDKD